ncbi:MAG: hypothetical protein OXK80_06105 [Bdellovibrionales bacterium]|nr:hypothetical protein [Bdellovibrionales bacterium]
MKFVEFFILFLTLILSEPVFSKQPRVSKAPVKQITNQNQVNSNYWNPHRSYGGVIIYISPNNTRLTLKNKNSNNIPPDNMVEKTLEEKKKMLSLIGIEDWTVTNSEFKKENENTNLSINGHYTDSKGRKVHFAEKHFYSRRQSLQILMTHFDPDKLDEDLNMPALESLIHSYRVR